MAGSDAATGVERQVRITPRSAPRDTSLMRSARPRKRLAPPFAAARRRLVVINLAVVTAILAVMAIAVYVADAHAIDQQIDHELVDRVSRDGASDVIAALASQTSATRQAPTGVEGERGAADGADSGERYEPSSPNVFAIGLDPHGHAIYDPGHVAAVAAGLPNLAAARPVLAASVSSTWATVGGEPHAYRLYTVPLTLHGQTIGALQVGISLDARERQLHDLLVTLALVGLAVMLITALASVYLAERALDPARRAFDHQRQFAAAASHELRTPLAFVRSQGDLVLRQLGRSSAPENQALAGDMRELVDEVDYMARLVRDLLLLARDAHDLRDARGLVRQRVDLTGLAAEVMDRMRPVAAAHAVELAVDLPAGADDELTAVAVLGDSDRLRQLLLILVENAVQYTPEGGSVTVSVRARMGRGALFGHLGHAPRAEVEVRDTGVGISPEHLEAIFAPFYQPDPALAVRSAGEHRGAGLGLALARWIVEAHGGSITVESAVGQGSTFRVALPLADEE